MDKKKPRIKPKWVSKTKTKMKVASITKKSFFECFQLSQKSKKNQIMRYNIV